jgi:hypothetical protein
MDNTSFLLGAKFSLMSRLRQYLIEENNLDGVKLNE